MDYKRALKLTEYTNNLIYSYLAFDRLPDKYKTISIHYFFLLLVSYQVAKNRGGVFLALDLVAISHYKRDYIFNWLDVLITRGFLEVVEKSVFAVSPFGFLAIKHFKRVLYRLMNSDKLPGYLQPVNGFLNDLLSSDIGRLKKSS